VVARDGVEPPTPAFSELAKIVVSTTYKVWVGCITTVETVPDRLSLGSILGVDATLPTRWRFVVSSPDSVSQQGIAQERFEYEKYKLTCLLSRYPKQMETVKPLSRIATS